MNDRLKSWVKAAGLALAPMAFLFPVLALARFGATGPARVWPVLLFVPVAMLIELRAIEFQLALYRNGRGLLLLAILPLGLISLFTYALSGVLFVLVLPKLLHRLI